MWQWSCYGIVILCGEIAIFVIVYGKGIDKMSDYLLLAASTDCLFDKILYDRAFGLVGEARRKKASSYKQEADRRRSLAAGILLNCAVRLWSESSFCENSGQGEKESDNTNACESSNMADLQLVDLKTAIESYDRAFDYPMGTMANGKPVFLEHQEIHSNLSHSGNYVVCAVSQCEVGVDIEGNRSVRTSIENRFFSEEECRWVCEADGEKLHNERFFRLWTLKEAYSKMTGEGISKGIGKAHFEVPLGENSKEKAVEWSGQCARGKNLERRADFYEYVIVDGYQATIGYKAGEKYYVAVAVGREI